VTEISDYLVELGRLTLKSLTAFVQDLDVVGGGWIRFKLWQDFREGQLMGIATERYNLIYPLRSGVGLGTRREPYKDGRQHTND
jgi:hypothetical protein